MEDKEETASLEEWLAFFQSARQNA